MKKLIKGWLAFALLMGILNGFGVQDVKPNAIAEENIQVAQNSLQSNQMMLFSIDKPGDNG